MTRFVLIGLVLALTTSCKGAAPLPPRAAELNRTGVQALQRGELETAEARFEVALEYSPRFVEALVNLGLVELQRGNFRRARQLLARARRLNPDVAQPHHGLGVLAERERRTSVAVGHYRDALSVDPGFAPARANLGRLLFESGHYEHAREQFRRLVEAAPDDVGGHVGLAEALLQLGRHAESDAVVEAARERFPDSSLIALLRGRGLLRRGDIPRAVAVLMPLSHEREDIAVSALGWLSVAELARGRERHAIGAARKALSLDDADPVATFALAAALGRVRDPAASAWAKRADSLAVGTSGRISAALAPQRHAR